MKASPLSTAPLASLLREIVRETAHQLEKEVWVHFSGELTSLEGSELSRLREALIQALQNSIDHGIETPVAREHAGKPAAGQIWVTFTESHGECVVTVRDDGMGVDFAAVERRAEGLGLLAMAGARTPDETLALLFQPGFSTKKIITEISGRGIGLDLVREVAESFQGTVKIDTLQDKGTTLTLRFPRNARAKAA